MMLKKLGLSIVLLIVSFTTYASDIPYFPDNLSIQQIKNCKKCVALIEDRQTIATLEPDPKNSNILLFLDKNKQIKLRLKYLNNELRQFYNETTLLIAHFDAFDNEQHFLASLDFYFHLKGYSFVYFFIHMQNNTTLVGVENTFGTKTNIYDYHMGANNLFAQLIKPLFTYSLDAKYQSINKQELIYSVNPDVFLAALALNSNTDFFYSIDTSYNSKKRLKELSHQDLYTLRKKLFDIAELHDMTLSKHPNDLSTEDMQAVKQFISKRYLEAYGEDFWDDENQDISKKKHQLINLGYDILLASLQTPKEEQALLQFLISQLD